jgi:hypothetical protein
VRVDIALVLVIFLVGVIIGLYEQYGVQRTYADLYADRYGHIPPLVGWAFESDPDPEVEYWRRLHRNLYVLMTVLAVVAIIIIVVRSPTWI